MKYYNAIPKALFSHVKEDDPYRDSKLFKIELWCYQNWDLHDNCGERRLDFLVKVLSDESSWKKVNNLHGVELDRQMIGKKLISPDAPFDSYKIACKYCLEKDVVALFEGRKNRLSLQGNSKVLEYNYLVGYLGSNILEKFWSHFVSGHINRLEDKIKGRHPYEYALECAITLEQVQALEFFWNRIKSLPEIELSSEKKDEIFMRTAVRAAGSNYNPFYPELFEFCFDQISPHRYSELLKRDLAQNQYYGSLSALINARSFNKFQKLFDHSIPNNISVSTYYTWLSSIQTQCYSRIYRSNSINLFLNIWMKDGFDKHRSYVFETDMTNVPTSYKIMFESFIQNDSLELMWVMLNRATTEQIQEFMRSKKSEIIMSMLKERNDGSLEKFMSYSNRSVDECSSELTDVDVSINKLVIR